MSVIGGILLFVSGVVVGGGAVAYNHYSVRRATDELNDENRNLKDAAWEDAIKYERDRAFREGYAKGRKNPLSDVERLADTIERKNMVFRTNREGEPDGQAAKR